MEKSLNKIYSKLYACFGPQYWWPAKSSFEVMVGAILTQNTSWLNVEKAIKNLKKEKLLEPARMRGVSLSRLASLIRPAGYYNIKAKRLKDFLSFLFKFYRGRPSLMRRTDTQALRRQLLSVKGVGPETADSILLYAVGRPVFVIDAYTRRILARHNLAAEEVSYEEAQDLFMKGLKGDVQMFNEYHALLVRLAKEFCLKRSPRCKECPLISLKQAQVL